MFWKKAGMPADQPPVEPQVQGASSSMRGLRMWTSICTTTPCCHSSDSGLHPPTLSLCFLREPRGCHPLRASSRPCKRSGHDRMRKATGYVHTLRAQVQRAPRWCPVAAGPVHTRSSAAMIPHVHCRHSSTATLSSPAAKKP